MPSPPLSWQEKMPDLPLPRQTPFVIGVLVGSGRGGVTTTERNMAALLAKGPKAVSPFFTPLSLVNMASGYISMKLGAKGPCLDVSPPAPRARTPSAKP